MEPLEFEQGALWRNIPWEIHFDREVYRQEQPCGHCYRNKEGDWTCPRAVLAFNEFHTAVCLDCILEVAQDGLPISAPVIPIPCKS